MIIQFPKQKLTPEVYDSLKKNYITSIINYIIDSKYRKSVELKGWLREQVLNPSIEVTNMAKEIESSDDYDIQIMNILRYVRQNITYIGDLNNWNMSEYWQTGKETASSLEGDCEDGAILIYLLSRIKGIPENRLLILAGNVYDASAENKMSGHCWIGYKANGYPVDYIFLDWCYWYNSNKIGLRNLFQIEKNTIYEHSYTNLNTPFSKSNYKTIWFGFNELSAYKTLTYIFDNYE